MPYTQATILEILRHGSVVSPGERLAAEDNTIGGTFYPKVCRILKTVTDLKLAELHCWEQLLCLGNRSAD